MILDHIKMVGGLVMSELLPGYNVSYVLRVQAICVLTFIKICAVALT